MPIRLDTVLRKVEQMANEVNSEILKEFYQHMKDNGTSQNYQTGINIMPCVRLQTWLNSRIAMKLGTLIARFRLK
jgi:hypothetical protein